MEHTEPEIESEDRPKEKAGSENKQCEEKETVRAHEQHWEMLADGIEKLRCGGKQEQRQLINDIRRGIPDELRPKIWPQLIPPPSIKYDECRDRVDNQDISRDVARTFPTLPSAKQIQLPLKSVLNALAFAIPEVGYCQGMNFIVGTLLMKLNQEDAFSAAYHILKQHKLSLLLKNLDAIHQKLYVFDRLMGRHYPKLQKQLRMHQIEPLIYAASWFITLFCNTLPFSYTFRILQCFFLEGEKILYRVALQILKIKKVVIKNLSTSEAIMKELKDCSQFKPENSDLFFKEMFEISLSRQDIHLFERLFLKDKQKQNV